MCKGLKPKQAWAFPYIQQASRNAAGPVLGVRFGPTPHPRPVRFFWWLDDFFVPLLAPTQRRVCRQHPQRVIYPPPKTPCLSPLKGGQATGSKPPEAHQTHCLRPTRPLLSLRSFFFFPSYLLYIWQPYQHN